MTGLSQAPRPTSVAPLRPPMLRPGDKVRLISPASAPKPEALARGVRLLREWGLEVEYAPHALDKHGYLAAPDSQRLADLNQALADPSVRAVICTRGGYGTQRILDGIDPEPVRQDPKLVTGFSDITALQMWLWQATGLASLHAPIAAWSDTRNGPTSIESLRSAAMSAEPIVVRRELSEPTSELVTPGRASGALLGGNVSLLAQGVGTSDLGDLSGAILFLEDVGEEPYRLDRMLTQLRRCGVLTNVAGIALGQFTDCIGAPDTWSVVEMLRDRLCDLGVPVLGGLPVGHGPAQRTIPLGVPAVLDADAGTLTAEPAVHA